MITYLILGITVVVSFICFGNQTLAMKLALSPYQVIHRQEWYRVVTHGFVHADMTHLLVNMFTFWSFGTYMEQYYQYVGLGKWGFLLLYFGGMIFASSFDLAKQKDNPYYLSIGASGAVSAVLFSSIFSIRGEKSISLPCCLYREYSSESFTYCTASIWPNKRVTISTIMHISWVLCLAFYCPPC